MTCNIVMCMQPVLGDMLTDLPEISSFTMAENAEYKTLPQTPFQQFLRRSPQQYESPQKVRAAKADKLIRSCREVQRQMIAQTQRSADGVEQVSHHRYGQPCSEIVWLWFFREQLHMFLPVYVDTC